jgi:hypothetical protein
MATNREDNTMGPLGKASLSWLLGILLFMASGLAIASGAPQVVREPLSAAAQASRVVLRVDSGGKEIRWTLAQLEALGMYRVTTRTYWPDDNGTYEGPLLAAVLKASGLDPAARIRVLARDGFSQVVPAEDLIGWPLMLATRRDGQPLDLARKGPLRIIYPRDMDPRLEAPVYRLRWVWMVDRIEAAP